MSSIFSTPSNQYFFIINLKSIFSWFSRDSSHNILVVLRSKKNLFPHLTTSFVHNVTHNKACIIVPWILGLGWLGRPSPAETSVSKLKDPVVSLQLLGLLAEATVWNKQQLGWFLRPESQVSSIFHFSMLFQQVAVGKGGKRCWCILQIFSHPTLETTSKAPAHQKSVFGAGKWSPKPYSMSPPMWDPKVIVAGTSKHTFWNYSNLKSAWRISKNIRLKLLQLNVRRHGPIIQVHSMTCHWTSFSM